MKNYVIITKIVEAKEYRETIAMLQTNEEYESPMEDKFPESLI